jgi:hypothetical protein
MEADLLTWAHDYLAQADDIVVPIKKLWNLWRAGHDGPDLDEFTARLLADERVEAMGGVDHTEGMDDLDPDERGAYVRDMEAHGYYSGPRVKLRARAITLAHVAKMIKAHNDRMEAALRAAREVMPDGADELTDAALIELQTRAAELRKALREAGLEAEEGGKAASE